MLFVIKWSFVKYSMVIQMSPRLIKDLESLTTALDQEYSSKCEMIKNISESTVPFTLHLTPALIGLVQMMLEQLFMDTMYI